MLFTWCVGVSMCTKELSPMPNDVADIMKRRLGQVELITDAWYWSPTEKVFARA